MHDSVRQFILYYRLLRGDGSPSFPQDGGTLYSFHSQTTFFLQNTVLKIFEIKVALSFPFPCVPSRYWLADDSISKKKKKTFERAMLLFFLVSPIRNRFFFESIWKKIVSFFIKRDSKGMRSPLQGFINNIENAILILCLLHQRRNPISRRETRKIIPSRYLSLCTNIYIYIIRTSVSQFLRESKREDRSGLIIVKGISN